MVAKGGARQAGGAKGRGARQMPNQRVSKGRGKAGRAGKAKANNRQVLVVP